MLDDRTREALHLHSERGHPRGAAAIHQDALHGYGSYLRARADVGAHPPRRPVRVALIVLAAVAVGAGLVISGLLPIRAQVEHAAKATLGRDRPPYDHLLDEWLAQYDPAERQHLRDEMDPNFGEMSKQYEVGTLEFRRTCRKLAAAIDAGEASDPSDRSTKVHEIMDPQLQRNDERDRITALADGSTPLGPGQGSMWEAWHTMTAEVAAGDVGRARAFIEGSCGDSLGPWIDR